MRFPDSFLEELRMRSSITTVVGRRVSLARKGDRQWGCCPFHNEKSPSFSVVEDKGFYHCFGCGAHGNVFDFLMKDQGLSFPDAVEQLARDAGMALPERTPEDAAKEEKRKSLYDVMAAVCEWYESQLNGMAGETAKDYLTRRGLSNATVKAFQLGYAPDRRTALKEAMLARKIPERALVDTGMLIAPEDGGESFDRFRHRVMFPILDRQGRIIAFGGRALGDAKAKYLNSPETTLFHKGNELYNLKNARTPAHKAGTIIVAEGYMDVIALVAAGFTHAVAPLGTALTESQLEILWKVVPEPTLSFDGDAAGISAAHRAADRALPLLKPGQSLRFCFLPEGEDPDSLIKAQGPSAMQTVLDKPTSLADVIWRGLVEAHDLSTPERRAGLQREMYAVLGRIADAGVKHFYEQDFKARLSALFRPQWQDRGGNDRGGFRKGGKFGPPPKPSLLGNTALGRGQASGIGGQMEELLVLTILNHPELLATHAEEFAEVELTRPGLDKIRSAALEMVSSQGYHDLGPLDHVGMEAHLREAGLTADAQALIRSPGLKAVWWAQDGAALADVETGWRHVLERHRKLGVLARELDEAQAACAEMTDAAFARLKAAKAAFDEAGTAAAVEGFGLASGRGGD